MSLKKISNDITRLQQEIDKSMPSFFGSILNQGKYKNYTVRCNTIIDRLKNESKKAGSMASDLVEEVFNAKTMGEKLVTGMNNQVSINMLLKALDNQYERIERIKMELIDNRTTQMSKLSIYLAILSLALGVYSVYLSFHP